ncbi:cytochrome P450 [Podospora conica]|nr:cytochrome P450 [Schizothecium conicum]
MAFTTIILLSVLGAIVPALAAVKHQAKDIATQTTFLLFCGLFVTQYILLTIYRVIIYPHFLSPMRHLPGPKNNWPLIGQFGHLLRASSPNELQIEWGNTWSTTPFIRYLSLANEETLLINTPEAHKEVFQTHCYAFQKPDVLFRFIGEIIGRGLLFAEGAEHKRQRRILYELFSMPNLKKLMPVFQEAAAGLAEHVDGMLGGEGRGVVDVMECFSKMALDLTGLTVVGVELENLKTNDPKIDFLKCFKRIFQPSALSALISFINTQVPIRRWIPLEANYGYIRATKEVRRLLLECVRQRIIDIDRANEKNETFAAVELPGSGRDLLTIMVQERWKVNKMAGDVLNEEDIVNQLLTFLVAGHETSAGNSTWAVYCLATHPEIQETLRAEIMDYIEQTQGATQQWSDIDKLPYLNNFCREVLRRYCPSLATYREPTTDLTLCGTFIPKGTPLLFMPAVANLSKATWGEDSEDVVPERWDRLAGDAATPYAFETFGNGPRVCIGKNFAMMEFKTQVIELVRRFRFEKSPQLEALGDAPPAMMNPAISLWPRDGMPVAVVRL